jgi:hypothetical protein
MVFNNEYLIENKWVAPEAKGKMAAQWGSASTIAVVRLLDVDESMRYFSQCCVARHNSIV